ncbi:MAG: aminotransferase class IV [Deltaproteobacteria bacterium]|jgi:branched-chain amino acid aminotransferase|nr:aminotransferase class IV [Deltaproteobacteria bacterium]
MIPVLDSRNYLARLLAAKRPGVDAVLAYYEYRVGAIVKDGSLMLAPLDDHMFHRGDGVFESMKFAEGRLYQFEEHMARLRRSAESICLEPPCPWSDVRTAALETTRAAGAAIGHLRLFLGRGPGSFGVDPLESPQSSFYAVVTRFTPQPLSWYEKGLTAFRARMPARPACFSHIKDVNYLNAVFMVMEGRKNRKDIPLCFDAEGHLAESAVANVCLVDKEGALVVPEFTHALPGTTILRAVELVRDRLACVTRPIPEAEIFEASELLLLGTSPGCVPLVEYEGRQIGSGERGPVARLINDLLDEDLRLSGLLF